MNFFFKNISIFIILIVTAGSSIALGQKLPDLPPPHRKLYKPEKNVLICHDTSSLFLFWDKLDSISTGAKRQVHILHLGDSHIQADLFSGRMRQLFNQEKLLPNAGRGFIFPYQLAKTNNPAGYNVSYTGQWEGCRNAARDKTCAWGLAGITATTYDTNATFLLQLGFTASQKYPIKRVKVFFPTSDPTSLQLTWAGKNTENILSDSVYPQLGYQEWVFKDSVTQLHFKLEKRDSLQRYFTIQGISLENDRSGLIYSSLGVNGAESSSFLKSPDLDKHLVVVQPDMVIISLGTNEAFARDFDPKRFRISMGQLIQRIKMAAPNTVILLTTPGDSFRNRRPNKHNVEATGVLFGLAEETGATLWDFYAAMGGYKSIQRWYANGLCQRDRLHLSVKGYQLQGNLFYTAIMEKWIEYRQNKEKK